MNARYPAPAKLNLDLRIVGRRPDGYHLLESIFCLIDLCDRLDIRSRSDGRIVLHTPAAGLEPQQDLCYRAAALLQKRSGSSQGADIFLQKHIPTGAGMGGGSSDAATVLAVLNHLWGCGFSVPQLMAAGLELGADVPFFLFGQNAFVQGIGEQMRPLAVPRRHYLIVKPPVHIATSAVFRHPALTRNSPSACDIGFEALQPFRNDMQAVVLAEYPVVAEVFRILAEYGSPMMTGSGSCLFLTFDDGGAALAVKKRLPAEWEVYCAAGLDRHPLVLS